MDFKTKAHAYHTAVSNYDQTTVTDMLCESYIQHNPKVPTGREAFVAVLPKLKNYQTKIENVRMLSDERCIVMHHVWKNAIPFGGEEMVAFHIIRFNAKGFIAEHWNVMSKMAPLNESARSLIDGAIEIRDHEKTAENKAKITSLFSCLTTSQPEETVEIMRHFFQQHFHQHHPAVADGIRGYQSAVENGKLKIDYKKQHKVFGEGNFVLSISEGVLDGNQTAFYDLFRLENGLIEEHWNVYQEIPTTGLANDNTMFNF